MRRSPSESSAGIIHVPLNFWVCGNYFFSQKLEGGIIPATVELVLFSSRK